MELGVAAHRLIMNSLGNRANTTGGAVKIIQQQQQSRSNNAVKGGLLNSPSASQNRPVGPPRPAGPPMQERGNLNSPAGIPKVHQGLGYGSRGPSNNVGAGYSGGERQRPHFQVTGQYPPQHHPYQVVPRAPPVHGGSGFMGRGNSQSGTYPAQAPGPPNGWATGRGGVAVVQQRPQHSHVARAVGPMPNGFPALDGQGQGQVQGRGRGRGRDPSRH